MSQISEMFDQWSVPLHMVILQNVILLSAEGCFILFDKILAVTIELPTILFQTLPDISLSEKLI